MRNSYSLNEIMFEQKNKIYLYIEEKRELYLYIMFYYLTYLKIIIV